jgi:hypothetical protein
LIEKEGSLVMNHNMKSKMISMKKEDVELHEEIKKETQKNQERTELPIDGDGYKRFKGLIFVPKDKEQSVIERYHDDIREGHPRIARAMEKIQRNYYFPGMFRKVKKHITECDSCNKNKNRYEKPKGEMTIDKTQPTRPWEQLTADFLEMPPSKHSVWTGKLDELLVVVDTFSKQTVLIPTRKTATTEEIFHLPWERVFAVFGIPKRIISDRDRIFKTEKWNQLMKEIGTKRTLSTAYHQQTDGQTERKIQELQAYFRHYLDYLQDNWIEITPLARYAVNDAKSSATGETPNFVTFGTVR